jgi:hypothetical protein
MSLNLIWKAHLTAKECIIGICPELPDSFCNFYIMRMREDKFNITLPGFSKDALSRRIVLRDPHVARQFCLDYLQHNAKLIIEHQIYEMKRRSSPSIKSLVYYEAFLQSLMGAAEQPPKKPFRKVG